MICKNCGKEIPTNSKCDCTMSKRDAVKYANQQKMIFNIFSISALVLAIIFTTVSFFISGQTQIIIIALAIILYITFFVCNIIKYKRLKK